MEEIDLSILDALQDGTASNTKKPNINKQDNKKPVKQAKNEEIQQDNNERVQKLKKDIIQGINYGISYKELMIISCECVATPDKDVKFFKGVLDAVHQRQCYQNGRSL